MAHYKAIYKCGHTDEIQLYGPTDSRRYRLKQMKESDCPECWLKKKKILPWLEGSGKQKAYASSIISEYIAKGDDTRLRRRRKSLSKYQESSTWWIENKKKYDEITKELKFIEIASRLKPLNNTEAERIRSEFLRFMIDENPDDGDFSPKFVNECQTMDSSIWLKFENGEMLEKELSPVLKNINTIFQYRKEKASFGN